MASFALHFYKNLVFSLSGFSEHAVWQSLLDWHFLFLPAVSILCIFAGTFLGVRTERKPGTVFYCFLVVFAAVCIISGVWLVLQPAPYWVGLAYYAAFSFGLGLAAYRAGVGIRILSNGPIVTYIIIGTAVVSVFFILFSYNLPSIPVTREELKKTFKSISGRDPNAGEKKAYWKGTVGEENPSAGKQDDHWKKQEKKK
jgi:hypothetical protein